MFIFLRFLRLAKQLHHATHKKCEPGYAAKAILVKLLCFPLLVVSLNVAAQDDGQVRIRGEILSVDGDIIVVKTLANDVVKVNLGEQSAVFSLSKTTFADVDFGTYVGAVSVRLDEYSPIVRDSMSWLHLGYELRIMDEDLRGIALGHTKWDKTSETVMSHGWVDDLEIRVLSIKYGPTEEEETDVDIPRDATVARMSIGNRSQLTSHANVFVGAQPSDGGYYNANYIMVGLDGLVPAL
ncbi:hypothetical protein P886_4831 [Alteromonadaceae bacterium 2753L.S.0a.02]|nr:hypothetical protein P886_4831 [Alteromonadaceae bacterium 2753L.S.0a.02]